MIDDPVAQAHISLSFGPFSEALEVQTNRVTRVVRSVWWPVYKRYNYTVDVTVAVTVTHTVLESDNNERRGEVNAASRR